MIKRISKENDLIIDLEIDLTDLVSLEIDYYTTGTYKFTATIDDIDITNGRNLIYIPSSELNQMETGLLKSTIRYAVNNSGYPDSLYNKTINQNLDVWIQ